MATAARDVPDAPRMIGDPEPEPGPLLGDISTPEGMAKVARAAYRLRESQDPWMERYLAQWRVNSARRRGVRNAKVIRDPDDHWTAWFPRNASPDLTPDTNKAARLCRRFVALMFVDPPAPHVEPPSGEDGDEHAAELSARALVDLQSESNLHTVHKVRTAFDRASEFGSGFVHYYIDPHGGGRAPVEVEAHPRAETLDDALIDPDTGLEQGPYVTRYVRPDGSLTDDPAEAAQRWIPEIRSEVLTGRHVRLIPHTADGIWDAEGAIISLMIPWSEAKRRFPEPPVEGVPALGDLPPEQREKLFTFRPRRHEDLLPAGRRKGEDVAEENEDERLVYVQITYYEQCDAYPEGLYLVTVGETYVAIREPWIDDSGERPEKALVPLAQITQWNEGREGWPHVGLMEILGGADEARAAQIAALLDHLDRINNRKILLPYTSTIQPQQLQQRHASVLYFNPAGGKPEWEDIAPYPRESLNLYAILGQEMDEDAGQIQTAEAGKAAESGRQFYGILSQVHSGLSEPRQGIERGYIRCCQIELQMARRFYRTPRKLRWVGDDGRYKLRDWTGADLTASTQDIRVKPGTLTMLSPAAKAQFAEHLHQLGILPPDELKEILTTNVGGFIGVQDDPFRLRIRRQLAEWDEGPPEGWAPPEPVLVDPTTGQPVDPLEAATLQAAGVPVQEVPAPDPVLARIFAPVPADELPDVAAMRLREIAKVMASTRYERKPPEWRAGLDAEFARMQAVVQASQMAAQPQPNPPSPPEGDGGPGVAAALPSGPEGVPVDAGMEGVPPEMMAGA